LTSSGVPTAETASNSPGTALAFPGPGAAEPPGPAGLCLGFKAIFAQVDPLACEFMTEQGVRLVMRLTYITTHQVKQHTYNATISTKQSRW